MKRASILILFILSILGGYSQSKYILPNDVQADKIKFKLINNLIIIPLEINGAELSFLLDSGVRKPIVFNLFMETDSLTFKNAQRSYLKGLGEGNSVMALKSENNVFRIGRAMNINQSMYAVFDENLNFSPRLGVNVHGIIGYDLFKDFIVEINYSCSYLKLHNPETYTYKNCKKCRTFNLEFHNNKPYFNAAVEINGRKIPVKLLIDSGGTDALWLFEDSEKGLEINRNYFEDFLGHGLSGSVYGKRSRIDKLYIQDYELHDVNVAFPDSLYIQQAKAIEDRSGSFSGNLLKRFNVIMDYQNQKLTLKKNRFFNEDFSYNKAGIELEQTGVRVVKERQQDSRSEGISFFTTNRNGIKVVTSLSYKYALRPAFTIVEIRKGSPAGRIGLKKGDLIVSVNNKNAANYNLQEISQFFYDQDQKKIRLKVERNGIPLTFVFRLKDPLN